MSSKGSEAAAEALGALFGFVIVLALIVGIDLFLAWAVSNVIPSFASSSHPGVGACFVIICVLSAIVGGSTKAGSKK